MALDCRDAIEELRETQSELYETNFNNILTHFDDAISLIDHEINNCQNELDLLSEKGYLTGEKYYSSMIKYEEDTTKALQKEIDSLTEALNEAVSSGAIKQYSEAWYSMVNDINAAYEAIQDATLAITEYQNAIDQLNMDRFEKSIEWIESAIDRLDTTVNDSFKTFSSRSSAITSEIDKINSEISMQQSQMEYYQSRANSVGLSSSLKKQVDSGVIDLNAYDDATIELIQEYMKWSEAANECSDSITALESSIASLYKTAFENTETQYQDIISTIDFYKDMIEESISQTEASGYITSTKYYDALIKQENENIKQLEKERDALTSSLEAAMKSGEIAKESEEWYAMCVAIDDVTLAIEEANTALIEYSNTIRDIEWSVFDLILERMEQINSESEFLISLMSNSNLYTDRGQLTDTGMATMGLYAVEYDTYMSEADRYADEMKSIQKELATDPYNQDLIDRYNELWEAQQSCILAAESEKDAIRDMVEEGINLEISSLKDLVDQYESALDAQKDLYDYQKKVQSQTQEIADLQKQLSAYAGDTSEETRATIQKLQISLQEAQESLEETEYERYVSDTKKMLDDLVDEYENVLNARLDDLDALIEDMISMVNENSSSIEATLISESEKVGYTLSDNMSSIWDTNSAKIADVVTVYGGNIESALTTTNSVLSNIDGGVTSMIDSLNSSATSITSAINDLSATVSDAAKASSSSSSKSSSSSSSSKSSSSSSSSSSKSSTVTSTSATSLYSSGSSSSSSSSSKSSNSSSSSKSDSNSSWGSWFVYRKCYYPKDKLNTEISIQDRLAYFDWDWDYDKRKDYYAAMGGPSVHGTYKGSATQNTWMISEMKSHGYAQGGTIGDMINQTGEDGFVLARTGEEILSLEKIQALGEAFAHIDDVMETLSDMKKSCVNGVKPMEKEINVDGINLNITLPNVENYEQFKREMQRDKNFENMIQDMTINRLFNGSSLKKYKY